MSEGRYRHAVVPLGFRGSAALFVAGGYVEENPNGDEIDASLRWLKLSFCNYTLKFVFCIWK